MGRLRRRFGTERINRCERLEIPPTFRAARRASDGLPRLEFAVSNSRDSTHCSEGSFAGTDEATWRPRPPPHTSVVRGLSCSRSPRRRLDSPRPRTLACELTASGGRYSTLRDRAQKYRPAPAPCQPAISPAAAFRVSTTRPASSSRSSGSPTSISSNSDRSRAGPTRLRFSRQTDR